MTEVFRPPVIGRIQQSGRLREVLHPREPRRGVRGYARHFGRRFVRGARRYQSQEDAYVQTRRVQKHQRPSRGSHRQRRQDRLQRERGACVERAGEGDNRDGEVLRSAPVFPRDGAFHVRGHIHEIQGDSYRRFRSGPRKRRHDTSDQEGQREGHGGRDDVPVPEREDQPQRVQHRKGHAFRGSRDRLGHASRDRLRQTDVGAGQHLLAGRGQNPHEDAHRGRDVRQEDRR